MPVANEVLGASSTIFLVEVLGFPHKLLNSAAFIGLTRMTAAVPFEAAGEAGTALGAVIVVTTHMLIYLGWEFFSF